MSLQARAVCYVRLQTSKSDFPVRVGDTPAYLIFASCKVKLNEQSPRESCSLLNSGNRANGAIRVLASQYTSCCSRACYIRGCIMSQARQSDNREAGWHGPSLPTLLVLHGKSTGYWLLYICARSMYSTRVDGGTRTPEISCGRTKASSSSKPLFRSIEGRGYAAAFHCCLMLRC